MIVLRLPDFYERLHADYFLNGVASQRSFHLRRRRLGQKREYEHGGTPFGAQSEKSLLEVLTGMVSQFESDWKGAQVSIYFHDLTGKIDDLDIGGARPGWAASTIKVPVMVGTIEAMERGRLDLGDALLVDHRLMLERYDPVSRMEELTPVSVFDLLGYMIFVSDNEATNMLADVVGLENINRRAAELGAKSTMLAHLLTSSRQYGEKVHRLTTEWNKSGSNLTTARDLTTLMTAIYEKTAAASLYCHLMQSLLEARGGQGPLSSYLPEDATVGGKIGHIFDLDNGEDHCETIVVNRSYALTVMCNRIPFSPQEAQWLSPLISSSEIMGLISRAVYDEYYFGALPR